MHGRAYPNSGDQIWTWAALLRKHGALGRDKPSKARVPQLQEEIHMWLAAAMLRLHVSPSAAFRI